ncbi:hypothetical protein MBCUT_04850 [Methanobrevibacter cuticularis]|uniref:Uncharacterized protein n=1 Tax=Methanobrevibacter cuticularis TaxID=47311 RepID=A0A166ENZ0_9EURY|nr:hypothetical protein [Methanobrevibacter cuticularis]KZX16855.1 hypothetical protein MBCUT_04850 [Methanobrevibacter cuticularis]
MVHKIKNALIQRDSVDESFELIDPNGYFAEDEVLLAIDNDTLITVQILIKAILRNDFKNWNEITEFSDSDSISSLFLKLGYKREEVAELLKDL